MKKNFKQQFQSLRSIIQTNVDTLKKLLEQSDELSKIITVLRESSGGTEVVEQLSDLKKNVSNSIDILISQTEQLFNSYDRLVEEIFGNQ